MITPEYSQLAQSALSMTVSERADLAVLLLRSLDEKLPPIQHVTSEAWAAEIRRRSNEVQRGEAELVDAEEALVILRDASRFRTNKLP